MIEDAQDVAIFGKSSRFSALAVKFVKASFANFARLLHL